MHMPRSLAPITLVACLLAPSIVRAEGPQDRHWVELEYFRPNVSSTVRLDSSVTFRGTTLSAERDLGVQDQKGTPYFLVGTRLGDHARLEFEYYELRRSGTQTINRNIQF